MIGPKILVSHSLVFVRMVLCSIFLLAGTDLAVKYDIEGFTVALLLLIVYLLMPYIVSKTYGALARAVFVLTQFVMIGLVLYISILNGTWVVGIPVCIGLIIVSFMAPWNIEHNIQPVHSHLGLLDRQELVPRIKPFLNNAWRYRLLNAVTPLDFSEGEIHYILSLFPKANRITFKEHTYYDSGALKAEEVMIPDVYEAIMKDV